MKIKNDEIIPQSDWVWYGYAGHLAVGKRCAYHLCTRIGNYLVSTVGAFFPYYDSKMETVGSGPDDYFETFIFECDGEDKDGNPNIIFSEVWGKRWETSIKAERKHRKICLQVAGLENYERQTNSN